MKTIKSVIIGPDMYGRTIEKPIFEKKGFKFTLTNDTNSKSVELRGTRHDKLNIQETKEELQELKNIKRKSVETEVYIRKETITGTAIVGQAKPGIQSNASISSTRYNTVVSTSSILITQSDSITSTAKLIAKHSSDMTSTANIMKASVAIPMPKKKVVLI
jgi:hypothetical protein